MPSVIDTEMVTSVETYDLTIETLDGLREAVPVRDCGAH